MDRAKWLSVCALLTPMCVSAADPGFYLGAAGGRAEQRLDKAAGVGPVPALATLPDPIRFPIITPPGLTFPPYSGVVAAFIAINPEIEADETDVGYGVALGYRVNKYFAAELTYTDAGEASLAERYTPLVPPGAPVPNITEFTRSYTVNTRGPALSLLGSLPLGEKWELFARGGVLFAEQEVRSRTVVTNATVINCCADSDYSDEVVTLGAGVQWSFLPRWTARLEYQRTDELQPNDLMGESRLDQTSLSVLFGL